jgi:riboflavin kinase / FMN adenylyltransferase
MKVVRGIENLTSRHRGCVVTVGNYDGVHRGHQAMIEVVRERAAELKCPSIVVAFEPSSKEFLDPEHAPPRITRWREKLLALTDLDVDYFLTLRFDERVRHTSPRGFEKELMIDGLRARHVVVGDDFRYGADAGGTIDRLRSVGREHGFAVEQVAPFLVDGVRVSSTLVRERLAAADFDGAAHLLGNRYRMVGKVKQGAHLGRELGFPTANLALKRIKSPVNGILAVRVRGLGAETRLGVASLGTRPTVDGVEPLLEVHIFDFSDDIYGRSLEVEFVRKLRDEEKFASVAAMVKQMHIDAAQARAVLA